MVPTPDESSSPPNNRKAVASIACGMAGFASLFVFPFGAFALGLPAITAGIHALREIGESDGAQGGDNLAVMGMLIGGVGLIFGIIELQFVAATMLRTP